MKIPSASSNILLLFRRTQAEKAYCPESGPMLLCSGWSTFWHCWFHLSILRASPIPCWSSAALVLFPFLWSSAARSKSGEPCAQKPSFFSFEARSLIGWSSSCCSVKCRHVNHAYEKIENSMPVRKAILFRWGEEWRKKKKGWNMLVLSITGWMSEPTSSFELLLLLIEPTRT